MEENKNQLPAQLNLPPEQVSRPVIKAIFNTELVRRNYLKILKAIQEIKIDRNNLDEAYEKVKEGERLLKELETVRKSIGDPYFKAHKEVKAVFDEATQPIAVEVTKLLSEIKAINLELSAEKAKAQAEVDRYNQVQEQMKNFINDTTAEIAGAPDDETLVVIQKRIGSEKSRVGFYGDQLPIFITMCEGFGSLINDRKAAIRKGKKLVEEQKKALEGGDLERATEIKEELELLEVSMEENVLRLQDAAFHAVMDNSITIAEPDIKTIKATTHRWKWRIDNIELLAKKMPHLTKLEPNKEAIEQLMAEKRKDGSLDGKTEVTLFGLTFYHHEYL